MGGEAAAPVFESSDPEAVFATIDEPIAMEAPVVVEAPIGVDSAAGVDAPVPHDVAWLPDAVELTVFLPTDTVGDIPPFPHPFWHPLKAAAWIVRMAFGLVSLVFLLALIAAIPIVNFLALGYLLEAEGRLARTGRLRFMFPLLDLAPRIGSIALGLWLWMWPLRILSNAAADARIIAPQSPLAGGLSRLTTILTFAVAAHVCLALARGGSLGCFFRPVKNVLWLARHGRRRDYWSTAESRLRAYVAGLRLKHHFWLGARGYAGAAIWLWPPTLLFATLRRSDQPAQVVAMLLGGVLLALVFAWVPFLQARLAAENRFGAMFELRAVRSLFPRAPIAWLVAIAVTYALALPLYLFKAVAPPQDALWLMTLVFVPTIYPAKIVTGWAYHRAWKRPAARWFGTRWACRLAMVPLIVAFVFFLFFTPYIAEHGRAVLFENHAFLLPAPF